jgi:ADP-ribose pyrophosphatase YjhB (NUDIX family)
MSVKGKIACPGCGYEIEIYRNPVPTVDIIIELDRPEGKGIVLIERKNFPFGWAIPGGFVDYGESADVAAVREAKEETGLDVELKYLLGVYSQPNRDPRQHTLSAVFVAKARGEPAAGDDARDLHVFPPDRLPSPLAFDHDRILSDYLAGKKGVWG